LLLRNDGFERLSVERLHIGNSNERISHRKKYAIG
jgi:hypothetical protein